MPTNNHNPKILHVTYVTSGPSLLTKQVEKTIKLKDEVGMAESKSTKTRFVRHKHLLYIPSLAFLDCYGPSY